MSVTTFIRTFAQRSGLALGGALTNYSDDLLKFVDKFGKELDVVMASSDDLERYLANNADKFRAAGFSDEFIGAFRSSADDLSTLEKFTRNFSNIGGQNFNAYLLSHGDDLPLHMKRALQNPEFRKAILGGADDVAAGAGRPTISAADDVRPALTSRGEKIVYGNDAAVLKQAKNAAQEIADKAWKASKISRFRKGSFTSEQQGLLRQRLSERFPDIDPGDAANMMSRAMATAEKGRLATNLAKGTGIWTLKQTAKVAAVGVGAEVLGQQLFGASPLSGLWNKISAFAERGGKPKIGPDGKPIPGTGADGIMSQFNAVAKGAVEWLGQYVGPEIAQVIMGMVAFGVGSTVASMTGVDKLPLGGAATMMAGLAAVYATVGLPDISKLMPSSAPSPAGVK